MGKEFVERCMYRLAIEDPNSTTGMGLRNSEDLMCKDCDGSREDAENVGCFIYRAPLPDGDATLRRDEGFVSEKAYRAREREAKKRRALEKELRELEGVAKLEALGEGGFIRMRELKDILGK